MEKVVVDGNDPAVQVVVGLATFRRSRELARVLPAVLDQARDLGGARVLVVDNDPDAGARAQVQALDDPLLSYHHEPRPGIAAARNRALDEAGPDADLLVFLDDDEVPQPGWLRALVDTWRRYRCAIVTGPVEAVPEDGEFEEWVAASGVFTPVQLPTGTLRNGAATNNVLYDLAVLRRMGARFDEEFGLSGGSDTMLAHLVRTNGGQIRWCAEARVLDYIPANRATPQWVWQRTVRTSNTWSRVAVRLAPGRRQLAATRAELTARGVYRLARGGAQRTVARIRRDRALDARGAADAASGIGILLGAYGVVRYEYRR